MVGDGRGASRKTKQLYLGKSERLDFISTKQLKVDVLCLWWRPRRVSAGSPCRRLLPVLTRCYYW